MKKIEVNKGDKYGKLLILKEVFIKKRRAFECKCECGNIINVILDNMRNGHTKSCGCYNLEKITEKNKKHGMTNTRIFSIWQGIKNRCNNKNVKGYKNYGGRGIIYDKKWEKFEGFYEDMGDTYKEGLSIERIDNNLGYSKENCKWIEKNKQQNNRRCNIMIGDNSLHRKCKEMNIDYKLVYQRIYKLGWDINKALYTKKFSIIKKKY